MPDTCGLPGVKEDEDDEEGAGAEIDVVLPDPINDSKASWENYGLYLIDNGSELFLWVSGNVVPGLVQDLFGTENLYEIPTGKTELPEFLSRNLNSTTESVKLLAKSENKTIQLFGRISMLLLVHHQMNRLKFHNNVI